ncbi:MAG: tRNA (adenosine(37)-N6)-dimethylallyltransferase MiaA, partial [SAR202 cluster bacterium]|nr:tRNA (adenosine(37)-N6)-dimethylallyltransferase MiaA [SAR202 cluster bacterium]
IVSADSRQVYRRMDIGTAKPSPSDRARVAHHLIDILDPDNEYSLAAFLRLANEAIKAIHKRGRFPIVVGGTGQYMTALLEGWQVPEVPPDTSLRQLLEQRAKDEGGNKLFEELTQLDPAAAARIDKRNVRRVIRALEIRQSETGQGAVTKTPPPFATLLVGLTLPRAELYQRIDERVDMMLVAGWLREVEMLVGMGYGPELPSMSSLGYQELVGVVADDWPLEQAAARIKTRTHRFARQQYAWFRLNDPRIRWHRADKQGFEAALAEAREYLRKA